MRYSLTILAVLCLAAPAFSADTAGDRFVPGQAADYLAIRGLQQRSAPALPELPAEGAPQAEVLLALAETATRAAEGKGESLSARDYDALYALLQKYRDDLKALGLKQTDLENQLVALKLQEQKLEEKIDALSTFALDGMKIYGRQSFTFDDLLLTGPAGPAVVRPRLSAGNAARYRTASLETDLFFTATRGPVSGLAELNYKTLLGTDWPHYNYFGVRQMQAELRTPIVAQVGDLDIQYTPFTVWRNDDEDPFDVEPFGARRQRRLDELTLKDHAVRIRGMRLLTDLQLYSQTIHLQVFAQGMGYPAGIMYYGGAYPQATTITSSAVFPFLPNMLVNGDYNTYLLGWQAAWSLVPAFGATYSGTTIFDSTDSNGAAYALATQPHLGMVGQKVRGYISQVHSLELNSSIADGLIKFRAEGAQSLYSNPNDPLLFNDPTLGASGYLTGTALMVEAALRTEIFQLKGNWHQVENTFISAPAQGRSADTNNSNYGPFDTESDRYNPQTGLYFDNFQSLLDPGESQLTRAFLPPQLKRATVTLTGLTPANYFFNYLLPYNSAVNAGSPYGYATPNRTGFGTEASLKLFNGVLNPKAVADVSSQMTDLVTTDAILAQTFTSYGAGATIDLLPLLDWDLKLKGGYRTQVVADGGPINFNSSQINGGLEWRHPHSTLWYAGYKHLNYTGTLAMPVTGSYQDPLTGGLMNLNPASATWVTTPTAVIKYSQAYDVLALGVRFQISDSSDIEANYTTLTFGDDLVGTGRYEMDQTFTKFNLRF